jgi:hypothetical protein
MTATPANTRRAFSIASRLAVVPNTQARPGVTLDRPSSSPRARQRVALLSQKPALRAPYSACAWV